MHTVQNARHVAVNKDKLGKIINYLKYFQGGKNGLLVRQAARELEKESAKEEMNVLRVKYGKRNVQMDFAIKVLQGMQLN